MFQFMEEILCFLVVVSLIIQLSPDDSYKKTLRFFIGIMLMVYILNCVYGILRTEELNIDSLSESQIWESNSIDFENIFEDHYEDVSANENTG